MDWVAQQYGYSGVAWNQELIMEPGPEPRLDKEVSEFGQKEVSDTY